MCFLLFYTGCISLILFYTIICLNLIMFLLLCLYDFVFNALLCVPISYMFMCVCQLLKHYVMLCSMLHVMAASPELVELNFVFW